MAVLLLHIRLGAIDIQDHWNAVQPHEVIFSCQLDSLV